MGRVLKQSYENSKDAAEGKPRVPEHPWFVFNNSWRLRCPIIHGEDGSVDSDYQGPDRTDHLVFANNAFEWCAVADGWLCEPIAPVANFEPLARQANVFDFNLWHCGSWPDYGAAIRKSGNHERNGIAAATPVFAPGSFDLAAASPGFGSADLLDIATPAGTVAIRQGSAGGLDRGAMQNYGLVSVPDLEAKAEAIVAAIIGLHPPGDLPVA